MSDLYRPALTWHGDGDEPSTDAVDAADVEAVRAWRADAVARYFRPADGSFSR